MKAENKRLVVILICAAVLLALGFWLANWPRYTRSFHRVRRKDSGESESGRSRRPARFRWGPQDPCGLQMAAWREPGRSVLRCVVRNHGDHSICYSDYWLGYWGKLTVEARPRGGRAWSRMVWRGEPGTINPESGTSRRRIGRAIKHGGASPSDVHALEPGEEMPPPYREGKKLSVAPTTPTCSFSVNLAELEWPDSWKGDAEVRISQKLGGDGSEGTWEGTLKSQVLAVPLREARGNPGR
jgi:hypothetical protein